MTVLDTVKGLIAAHGANAVGAFTVADIRALVDYITAAEACRHLKCGPLDLRRDPQKEQWIEALESLEQARIRLGLAEKEAGRG